MTAENARLAGELLKMHSASDKEDAQRTFEFEKKLKTCEETWTKRLQEKEQNHSKMIEDLKKDVARRTKLRDEEWGRKVEVVLAKNNSEIEALKRDNEALLAERDKLKAGRKDSLTMRLFPFLD